MSSNMEKPQTKILAEIFATLRAINKMIENEEEGQKLQLSVQEQRKRIALLRKNNIKLDESIIKKFNVSAAEGGTSIIPQNMAPLIKYEKDYVESILPLISDNILSKSEKEEITTSLNEKKIINVDTIEDNVKERLGDDEKSKLERIEVEIDVSQPSKELVKSFLVMSEALGKTIEFLNNAIEELKAYLDDVEKNPTQNVAVETEEKASPKAEVETQKAETVAKTEDEKIEDEVSKEQEEIAKNASLFGGGKSEDTSEVGSAIGSFFSAPMHG